MQLGSKHHFNEKDVKDSVSNCYHFHLFVCNHMLMLFIYLLWPRNAKGSRRYSKSPFVSKDKLHHFKCNHSDNVQLLLR